VDLLGFVIGI